MSQNSVTENTITNDNRTFKHLVDPADPAPMPKFQLEPEESSDKEKSENVSDDDDDKSDPVSNPNRAQAQNA